MTLTTPTQSSPSTPRLVIDIPQPDFLAHCSKLDRHQVPRVCQLLSSNRWLSDSEGEHYTDADIIASATSTPELYATFLQRRQHPSLSPMLIEQSQPIFLGPRLEWVESGRKSRLVRFIEAVMLYGAAFSARCHQNAGRHYTWGSRTAPGT